MFADGDSREVAGGSAGVAIDPWWCPDQLWEDNFVFYLVI